jgi:hypothetical protein
VPSLSTPHFRVDPVLSFSIAKDLPWGEHHLGRELWILPQRLDGFNWVSVTNSEFVIWSILKGQLFNCPLSSSIGYGVDFLVQFSNIAKGQPQRFLNLVVPEHE